MQSQQHGVRDAGLELDAESGADHVKWPGLAAAVDGLKTKRVHVDFDSDVGPPSGLSEVPGVS